MAESINKIYDDAVASGILPGISVFAGDKDGKIIYNHSAGKSSLSPSRLQNASDPHLPFTASTPCAIASMTKLMTSIAVLQCVEDGTLNLDADVKPFLPQIGKHGIITSFDGTTNSANLTPIPEAQRKITARMLLCHTSGHEYDWFNPQLAQWRASRGEQPWTGPTVEDKSALPLVFAPGEGFAYGAGHDWAGRLVEVVNKGKTLEEFMRERIWRPLGIADQDVGFLPVKDENVELKKRMATLSSLDEAGNGPAFDLPGFDMLFGGEECLGGGGGFCTAEGYYTFLSAVLRRDSRLLKTESWEELFRPQLDEKLEGKLNEYLAQSEMYENFLGFRVPRSVRKNWSFAGLVVVDGQEGRFGKNTVLWGGVPSCAWWMDREMGVCGVSVCQVLPPMCPTIMKLHEEFQKGVYSLLKNKRD
ncbi:Beta-lactamase/transpeptidase-like protein [Naviculisporaceae sp. PSN 640]